MNTGPLYIPADARKVTDKVTGAVAYLYERAGKPCAMVAAPKATQKHCGRYAFTSELRRAKWVEEMFNRFRSNHERKANRRAARAAFRHSLEVGHVLKSSWGYEQTNVDFYIVTKVMKTQVEICQIPSITVASETYGMCGQVIPDIEGAKGEPMRRRVTEGNAVRIESYAYAYIWEGRPENFTAYA